ncbi:flagellin lysine-N-methylase [Paraclostridium bifermentans]
MKKYKNLRMDYYDDFRCSGNKCEDTCCKEWNITIDKKTYMTYKNLKNSEFKNKLMKSIGRNRQSKSELDYSKIKLVSNKCPMLSENGLCEVYINLGEEYMCNTCKTYPRSYNLVEDTIESSLCISCIEVARNILLREEPIEFNLDLKESDVKKIEKNINNTKFKTLREKYFNEIRIFSIGLVQNRRFSIEERLTILGLFIKTISRLKEDLVIQTIQQYDNNIQNGAFDNLLKDINFDNTIDAQLEFLTNIYKIIISKNIRDQRFMENFINIVNKLQLVSSNPELIKDRFVESLNDFYNPFMKNYEYIYENYLVNYMFKNLFPISNMSLLDTYVNLVAHFSVIKMNLIGLCGHYKEEMDDEKVLHFIQSFAKVVEHDITIVDKLHRYLSENEMNTFAHMVILMGK